MASRTSLIGALGMGKQSAKGSIAGSYSYLPATSINLNPMQQVQTLPPEIGGSYFLRGSYKTGVAVSGDAGLVIRPDGVGHLLSMLSGAHTTGTGNGAAANPLTPPTVTDVATGGTLGAGVFQVAYSYVTAGGESMISPTAGVTLASATDKIHVAGITFPTGVTSINFYTSAAPGSGVLKKNSVTQTITATATDLIAPSTGAAPPSANTTGTPDGSYDHVFTPFAPGPSNDLPWYSIQKDVGQLYADQFVDVKLNSLRFDISKQQIATAQASFFGITPSEIASVAGAASFDSGPYFANCSANVLLSDETGVIPFPAAAMAVERVSLDFNNNLSQDEYVVGSFFPYDVTLLQRTATISYDIVIRDTSLVRAVYRNGGSSAWSPTIVRGHLNILLQSSTNIAGASKPYSLAIDLPGIDFMMMPVPLQGAQLIRASLSAQVTLGTTGMDTFAFHLVNDQATY